MTVLDVATITATNGTGLVISLKHKQAVHSKEFQKRKRPYYNKKDSLAILIGIVQSVEQEETTQAWPVLQ